MNVPRWLQNIITLLAFTIGGGMIGAACGALWYMFVYPGPVDGWIILPMMFGAAPAALIGIFWGGAYLTDR